MNKKQKIVTERLVVTFKPNTRLDYISVLLEGWMMKSQNNEDFSVEYAREGHNNAIEVTITRLSVSKVLMRIGDIRLLSPQIVSVTRA